MKKTIFKFWLVNLLISIALYFYYRIVIIEMKSIDTSFLGKILYILDIWANLSFSMIYLCAMILGAFTFFLNLLKKVRDNTLLSFLTFSGIPLACAIFLIVQVLINIYQYDDSPLKTLLRFTMMYLGCSIIEFFLFKKMTKNFHQK